ncbi:pelargonidin 3-O-(6-caffeoylglucoside) 5-O-(6-O-malonylglucoside) 4'''-malonyltransferase-like protein [Tanacetum coccineum]|uniref:Pelargonidin 3-O-(6-caffeoylglucoside) 5-O-(6-O-malonylglucoside) 4'''-malonyltransferase-like protein n=1 Tax=Tanacetum coccineum TaxID=301880 RepID=A0ABQ4Z4J5_9ASTR
MEIINKTSKLVKPATPTPSNLRNYNVSFFDEQMPNINVPLILYYSTSQNDVHVNIFNHLETSLAKTLTDFYPLAGRYVRDGSFIDCSDQGALYVQATANFQLSEFIGLAWDLKFSMLRDLLPCEIGEAGEVDDPMLFIKVTTFECGGFAIGMCSSHKISDMSTMCTFIINWATRSQASSNNALELENCYPIFTVPRDFPKRELNDLSPRLPRTSVVANTPARIFLFKGNAISKLREKIIFEDNEGRRPSKVQLVVALLWKTFVGIDKANNNGQSKASFVSQGVNLRDKAVPKLPDNLCGNFVSVAVAQTDTCEADDIDLQGFYMILHDSLKKYDTNYATALSSGEYDVLIKPFLEYSQNIMNSDVNFYAVTSWCKFSFNKADFGWGKPVWRSTGQFAAQNFVVMMDDQEGDGIEAWVHFDEKRMRQLEQDPDIKAYAIYTPSQ